MAGTPRLLRAAKRHYCVNSIDSRRWEGFSVRADDIIVASFAKTGTTWTQRIVDMLVFQSTAVREFLMLSPWLDSTLLVSREAMVAHLEAQTHRRYIKSHLPLDGLPLYEGVKIVHVARDGRDACLSMQNHELGFRDPGRLANPRAPSTDPGAYFREWIEAAEAPESLTPHGEPSFFAFERTYWEERHNPDLMFVHYNDLKADLEGEIARISAFLNIDTPPALLREMAEAARFERMKRDGDQLMPQLYSVFDRGPERFINKGENGRWRGVLTEADLARYDALARRMLPAPLVAWLEAGRAAGDPRSAA